MLDVGYWMLDAESLARVHLVILSGVERSETQSKNLT